jgi:hypothetical protein
MLIGSRIFGIICGALLVQAIEDCAEELPGEERRDGIPYLSAL